MYIMRKLKHNILQEVTKMKKPMFSVFDKVANLYTVPFLESTDGTAVRFIQDQMSKDIPFSRHPQDFRLDRLGDLDEESGTFDQSSKATIIEIDKLRQGE